MEGISRDSSQEVIASCNKGAGNSHAGGWSPPLAKPRREVAASCESEALNSIGAGLVASLVETGPLPSSLRRLHEFLELVAQYSQDFGMTGRPS